MRRALIKIAPELVVEAIPALEHAGLRLVGCLSSGPDLALPFIFERDALPVECERGFAEIQPIFTKRLGEPPDLLELRMVPPIRQSAEG